MKVQVNDAENSQKELIFEIPYEEYEKIADKELDKLIPKAKVPGFRPGKAPRDVAKKQFAHKVKSQSIEKLINNAVQEGMTSNEITPLSQAYISDVEFEDNKPIKFKARVDVFPQIKLEKCSGFSVEKVEVKVTDSDVDKALESLQEKEMTYEPVTNRDTVKSGDIAVIDFEGKKDGVAFEGGSAKNFSLNIGSGQFIPGFEDGVIGMKTGETKDLNLTFPKDYGSKDLAGQKVVFTVTVHELKEKVKPELNDEFIKDIDPNSKGLSDFKARLKKGLQTEINNSTKMEAFGNILGQIVEANPFDIPYSFVKEQAERLAYNGMNQFYQMGLDPEQVGINFEMMVQRYIPQATAQVKQAIVINEIAKNEGITVDDKEVDDYLSIHAELQGRPLAELKEEVEANMQMEPVKNEILGNKVFEYLSNLNDVKVKKMSKDEYEKEKSAPKPQESAEKKPKSTAKKTSKKSETSEKEVKAKAPKKTAGKSTDKDKTETAKKPRAVKKKVEDK